MNNALCGLLSRASTWAKLLQSSSYAKCCSIDSINSTNNCSARACPVAKTRHHHHCQQQQKKKKTWASFRWHTWCSSAIAFLQGPLLPMSVQQTGPCTTAWIPTSGVASRRSCTGLWSWSWKTCFFHQKVHMPQYLPKFKSSQLLPPRPLTFHSLQTHLALKQLSRKCHFKDGPLEF